MMSCIDKRCIFLQDIRTWFIKTQGLNMLTRRVCRVFLCRNKPWKLGSIFRGVKKRLEVLKLSAEKLSDRPKFRRERFSDKKNPKDFPSESFRC